MAPSSRLVNKNVRPKHISKHRRGEDATTEENLDDSASNDSGIGNEDESEAFSSEEAGGQYGALQDEIGDENVKQQISNVSFGALLQAQDALSRKRKRGSHSTAEQDAKLDAIRARLQEIRSNNKSKISAEKPQKRPNSSITKEPGEFKSGQARANSGEIQSGEEVESDSDSSPSEEEEAAPSKSRTSKHAPATQSSRHQVTRKRDVIEVPKSVFRDPRFDALHQSSAHPGNSEKAYSFLRDYQKAEIAELKAAIKQAKNEDEKDILRRKVVSMENRLKAKEAKEREQEVLRKHRKEEKEKVEQGKQPFYLKKKEQKERALVEKFKGMKSKDRERLIEKRRKKESQKEMKRMPDARRVAG